MKNIIRFLQIILILLGAIGFSSCEKKNTDDTIGKARNFFEFT